MKYLQKIDNNTYCYIDNDRAVRATLSSIINNKENFFSWEPIDKEILSFYLCLQGKFEEDSKLKLLKSKIKAFIRSAEIAGINSANLQELCPEELIREFVLLKEEELLKSSSKKPENYDFLYDLFLFANKIGNQELNVPEEFPRFIYYDIFGTVTGRFTTKKKSFPILTISKEKFLKPKKDYFMEFDYNAADFRMLLALLNKSQPKEDLYSLFLRKQEREQTKKYLCSWLYGNNHKSDKELNNFFGPEEILEKYFDGNFVTNPFKRRIKCDRFHALCYLLQSTVHDNLHTQAMKFQKEKIAFTRHDSIVFDLSEEEVEKEKLQEIFENTSFGWMKSNIKIGENFGEMK